MNNFTAGYSFAFFHFAYGISVTGPGLNPFVTGDPMGAINIGGANGATAFASAGGGPNTGAFQANYDNIFTYQDQVHITKGIHSITVGGWLERLQDNEFDANYGIMAFTTLTTFLTASPTTFTVIPATLITPARVWMGAWFFQDAMQLRPNLTLSLGLRHEFTNGWHDNYDERATLYRGRMRLSRV